LHLILFCPKASISIEKRGKEKPLSVGILTGNRLISYGKFVFRIIIFYGCLSPAEKFKQFLTPGKGGIFQLKNTKFEGVSKNVKNDTNLPYLISETIKN